MSMSSSANVSRLSDLFLLIDYLLSKTFHTFTQEHDLLGLLLI